MTPAITVIFLVFFFLAKHCQPTRINQWDKICFEEHVPYYEFRELTEGFKIFDKFIFVH